MSTGCFNTVFQQHENSNWQACNFTDQNEQFISATLSFEFSNSCPTYELNKGHISLAYSANIEQQDNAHYKARGQSSVILQCLYEVQSYSDINWRIKERKDVHADDTVRRNVSMFSDTSHFWSGAVSLVCTALLFYICWCVFDVCA